MDAQTKENVARSERRKTSRLGVGAQRPNSADDQGDDAPDYQPQDSVSPPRLRVPRSDRSYDRALPHPDFLRYQRSLIQDFLRTNDRRGERSQDRPASGERSELPNILCVQDVTS